MPEIGLRGGATETTASVPPPAQPGCLCQNVVRTPIVRFRPRKGETSLMNEAWL